MLFGKHFFITVLSTTHALTCHDVKDLYQSSECCSGDVSKEVSTTGTPFSNREMLLVGVGYGPASNEALGVSMLHTQLMAMSNNTLGAVLYEKEAAFDSHVREGVVDATFMPNLFVAGINFNVAELAANGLATSLNPRMTALNVLEFLSTDVGRAQQTRLYESLDVVGFPGLQVGPEALGWSKVEITGLDVWKSFSSSRLPGGSLRTIYKRMLGEDQVQGGNMPTTFQNVKDGVYDFWEWNGAYVDSNMIANFNATLKTGAIYKYHYPAPLHQRTGTHDLVFARSTIDKLGTQKRAWIEEACRLVAKEFHDEALENKNRVVDDIRNSRNGWSGVTLVETIPADISSAYLAAANSTANEIGDTEFQRARGEFKTFADQL